MNFMAVATIQDVNIQRVKHKVIDFIVTIITFI